MYILLISINTCMLLDVCELTLAASNIVYRSEDDGNKKVNRCLVTGNLYVYII